MKYPSSQIGATLIEVAITVLILATSVLAMATLQTRSLQYNQSAYMRSQANIHVYDIIDRMRLNRGTDNENRLDAYTTDYDDTPSGDDWAAQDVADWRALLEKNLPEGKGAISCVQATRICKISVRWSEAGLFGEGDEDNPEGTTEFTFSSSI